MLFVSGGLVLLAVAELFEAVIRRIELDAAKIDTIPSFPTRYGRAPSASEARHAQFLDAPLLAP